jgi:hypothetical protein
VLLDRSDIALGRQGTLGKHLKHNLRPQSRQKNPHQVINSNRHGLQRQRQPHVDNSSKEDAKHFKYNQGQKRFTNDSKPTQHIRKRLRAQHIALASAQKEMDLINYLLKHLSVDKLITAMKDRGFVLASSHLLSTHFPQAQSHLNQPSSPPHHVPAPHPPAHHVTAPPQLHRHRNAEREREREKERERERQRGAASTGTQARAGPTTAPPLPLPGQVTGPPLLTPFPIKGKGAKKKTAAV